VSVVKPVLLALAVTAAASAVTLFFDGWRLAWLAATGVALVAAAVTLPMLVATLKLPPAIAWPRVTAIGMLRAVIMLAGAVAAWQLLGLSRTPTIVLAMLYYAVLLAVETWAAGRAVAASKPSADVAPTGRADARGGA
jgi:hypothetical protein